MLAHQTLSERRSTPLQEGGHTSIVKLKHPTLQPGCSGNGAASAPVNTANPFAPSIEPDWIKLAPPAAEPTFLEQFRPTLSLQSYCGFLFVILEITRGKEGTHFVYSLDPCTLFEIGRLETLHSTVFRCPSIAGWVEAEFFFVRNFSDLRWWITLFHRRSTTVFQGAAYLGNDAGLSPLARPYPN